MATLVNRETLYERTMNVDALAAWAELFKVHILASPINKINDRSK